MNRKTYIRSEYKADREAAKEYLSQLYRLDLRIKSKKMQIEALDDCLKSITVNTDAQSLYSSLAEKKINIGRATTA